MGLWRYPRHGYRIAPVSLADVLAVPVPGDIFKGSPGVALRLSDLDSTVWERFGAETCEALADAVVRQVQAALPRIRSRRLPRVPDGVTLDNLDLSVRTYNCLRFRGVKSPQHLGDLTVGEVLQTKAFGVRSLVDLLTSLESLVPPGGLPGQSGVPKPVLDQALTCAAQELERLPGLAQIRRDDPRLGFLVVGIEIGATTAQAAVASVLVRSADPPASGAVVQRIHQLRDLVSASGSGLLEDELLHLASWVLTKTRAKKATVIELDSTLAPEASVARHGRLVARHLGWDGGGGVTLRRVGNEFGMSRERVRQVCEKCTEALIGRLPYAPVLDRALQFVLARAPAKADAIEAALANEGISRKPFRLEGLARAAELLGRHVLFSLAFSTGSRMIVPAGKDQLADTVIRVARRTLERWGVATVSDVAAQVSEAVSGEVNAEFVRRVVTSRKDFQWLDEETGWFWLHFLRKNRLLTQIRKIMAVAHRIHVSEMRAGVSRHYELRGFAPPRRVLLKVCRQIPAYRVDGEVVIADRHWNGATFLSVTEKALVGILEEGGGVMQRLALERAWLAKGLNRDTLYTYLTYSPVVAWLAPEVYGLRGAEISPGVVESLIPQKKRPRQFLLDFGWTQGRKIWIGYRLSRAMLLNGTLGIPAAVKRFLDGEYVLRTADGSLIGKLVVREHDASGLGSFYRRRGGEEGDNVVVVFDLGAREATVSLGDVGLVEGPQTTEPD